jgi:hypothetical protein
MPRHLVTVAQRHDFSLRYPSLKIDIHRMPGNPGPASHQHRFRDMSRHDYRVLCQLEDAIARDIEPGKKCMIILPSQFVLPDSVPFRMPGIRHVTLSMGFDKSGSQAAARKRHSVFLVVTFFPRSKENAGAEKTQGRSSRRH